MNATKLFRNLPRRETECISHRVSPWSRRAGNQIPRHVRRRPNAIHGRLGFYVIREQSGADGCPHPTILMFFATALLCHIFMTDSSFSLILIFYFTKYMTIETSFPCQDPGGRGRGAHLDGCRNAEAGSQFPVIDNG
jgi:hypothetical protein